MSNMTLENLSILNELRDIIGQNATKKGFRAKFAEGLLPEQWAGKPGQLIRAAVYCMNLVGEVSEFWEAFRAGSLNQDCDKASKMVELGYKPLTNAEEEIADQLIRVLDKAQIYEIDIARAVHTKMMLNTSRPHLHGNKNA